MENVESKHNTVLAKVLQTIIYSGPFAMRTGSGLEHNAFRGFQATLSQAPGPASALDTSSLGCVLGSQLTGVGALLSCWKPSSLRPDAKWFVGTQPWDRPPKNLNPPPPVGGCKSQGQGWSSHFQDLGLAYHSPGASTSSTLHTESQDRIQCHPDGIRTHIIERCDI